MSVRQRAVYGVIWSTGISVAAQASSFFLTLGLARLLGKEIFGQWGIIQTTLSSIAGIAQLSMAVMAAKYVAQFRDSNPSRLGSVLGLSSLVTIIMSSLAATGLFFGANYVADVTLRAPYLKMDLEVSAIYLFFSIANGFQIGALSGFERFKPLALIGTFYGFSSLALILLFAYGAGLRGALSGLGLMAAVNWAIHHRILKRECQSKGIEVSVFGASKELSALFRFTLPATLSGIAGSIAVWFSGMILARQPAGFEQFALFAAATSLKSLVLFMPNVVARVLMPVLVNLLGNSDYETYLSVFRKNLIYTTGMACVVAAAIAMFAPYILLAFGKSFEQGSLVVILLAACAVFEVLGAAIYQKLFNVGWMWWGLSTVLFRSSILVVAAFLLVPALAAVGLAVANLLAYFLGMALTYLIVRIGVPVGSEALHQGK